MTDFPDAEAYIRAVQNPRTAFRDPRLQEARFEVHPILQVPIPASGQAAVVFRARVGTDDCALRFFTRDEASTDQRYDALAEHFATHDLATSVALPRWADDAILVEDRRWPMVRMEWIEGRTLDAYVGHLVTQGATAALVTLAGEWRALVGRMQAARFAHGDLQHGNVLVDESGTLRLVDFDGSWIEPFAGGPPPAETGHPNYQPRNRPWGRWMDSFPGLVVYLALRGLAHDPTPWGRLANGENILFADSDFQPPFDTPAWRSLTAIGDPEIDHLVARLQRCCTPGWVPDESMESLLARERPDVPPTTPPTPPATPPSRLYDDWWKRTGVAVPYAAPTELGTGKTQPVPTGSLPRPPRSDVTDVPDTAHTSTSGAATGWYSAPEIRLGDAPTTGAPAPDPDEDPAQDGAGRSTTSVLKMILIALAIGLIVGGISAGVVYDSAPDGAPVGFVVGWLVTAVLILVVQLVRHRR